MQRIELTRTIDASQMTNEQVEAIVKDLQEKEELINWFYNLHPSHKLRKVYASLFGKLGKDVTIEIANIQFLKRNYKY